MKQHTNITIYSYIKREEKKEEKESVMKHRRVSIAGDSVHAVMDSVTPYSAVIFVTLAYPTLLYSFVLLPYLKLCLPLPYPTLPRSFATLPYLTLCLPLPYPNL
jgi:hypothetical protein